MFYNGNEVRFKINSIKKSKLQRSHLLIIHFSKRVLKKMNKNENMIFGKKNKVSRICLPDYV